MSRSPDVPHLPVLRSGVPYESLETAVLADFRDGRPLAVVSQSNAGLIRRDLRRVGERAASLRALPVRRVLAISQEAGRRYLEDTLPLGAGCTQSPNDYVESLSASSGLPHAHCRRNMQKVFTVFDRMPEILRGLMRGLDVSVLDGGLSEHLGLPISYASLATSLGVVLPSNSPGVNSLWMPALAMKVPVVLKPGREEPWTPYRIVQAFLAAGLPPESFSYHPTDHVGAATILEGTDRALLFGDERTTAPYTKDPRIEIHGPGRSKLLLGDDEVGRWRDHLDVLVRSILDNGGRSCINASTLLVPDHAEEIAAALASRLACIGPRDAADPNAALAAFAKSAVAVAIDAAIDQSLAIPGAVDVTARSRIGPRRVVDRGATYLLPTVVLCDSIEHPLARTEYLFPFVSVVQVPSEQLVEALGPSLVVTAITRDPVLIEKLVRAPTVERLNLGPVPTTVVEWDQPHEGNLFEFLYRRRAIQQAPGWGPPRGLV